MKVDDELLAAIGAIPLALEQTRAQIAQGLAEFHNGSALRAARVLQIGATGAATLAWTGPGRLVGWSVRATGGPVTVLIRDARADAGDILAALELVAGSAETIWLGPGGLSFAEGLYVRTEGAGQIQGALYLGAVD